MPLKNSSNEKKRASSSLKKNIADILVASHVHEPYILAFRYSGENVAQQTLGSLVGFFEIDIHDQDAAYIVNFLASVAKKEYFANVRRGPVESFEAALHKVNVALSELVKHGNVSWLGHLHGAMAVLVKNQMHFSVTGDASLFLFRDGSFRSISEGLAEKETEPHPLKTFVEIAGGDLYANDRVFLVSSAIWTLFTPGDIERSANRFTGEALEQFLRTALINELDSAALVLVSCEEETLPQLQKEQVAPPETEVPSGIKNVFSESIFLQKKKSPRIETREPAAPKKESEFIDQKTGHIYVQGESLPNEEISPFKEKLDLFAENMRINWKQFMQKSSRSSRKWRKELRFAFERFQDRSGTASRAILRKARSLPTKFPQKRNPALEKTESPVAPAPVIEEIVPAPPLRREALRERFFSQSARDTSSPISAAAGINEGRNAAISFFRNLLTKIQRGLHLLTPVFQEAWQKFLALWSSLSRRTKLISFGILIIAIGLFSWYATVRKSPPAVVQPSPSAETQPQEKPLVDAAIPALSNGQSILELPSGERLIGLLELRAIPWAITETALYNLSTGEKVALPESVRLATDMDDLQTIFLWTKSEKLLAFTPVNKKFTSNTLPLPDGTKITAFSSYLTYLYILDATSGKIFRFPRSEGGFGAATSWLKESVTFDASSTLSVNDLVAVASNDRITSYSRGKSLVSNFEIPRDLPHRFIDIVVLPETNETFSLDTLSKQLFEWNAQGKLKNQWLISSLPEASRLTVSDDQKTILVGSDKKVLRFSIP